MQLPPPAHGLAALPPGAVPGPVREFLLSPARPSGGGYAYLPEVAAGRARALKDALPEWARVLFAVKANGFPPVLAALAGAADGFEVASAAEAAAARAAAPAGTLWAAGPAKSPDLLRALLAAPVDVVTVESVLELHRLSAVALESGVVAEVALRVNPRRVAARGELAMGGAATPFGIPEPDLPEALELAARLPGVRVTGLHVHAVSGVMDAAAYVAHLAAVLELAAGHDVAHVGVGGGLGVLFDGSGEFELDRFGELASRLRPPAGADVVLEPGRWIAADCGWYAAEVVDVKHAYGTAFVLLRGGIGHFALPTSWDLAHRFAVLPVQDWPAGLPRPEARGLVTVAGELCTPEDTLAVDHTVERVRAGDLVVFPRAGAYGWEFALPAFLGHPPAWREALRNARTPGPAPSP